MSMYHPSLSLLPGRSSHRVSLAGLMIFSLLPVLGEAQSKPNIEEDAIALLQKNCVSCHSELRISNLDLRQRESILKGGTRGPAVVPGRAEESLLYKAAAHSGELKMPPRRAGFPRRSSKSCETGSTRELAGQRRQRQLRRESEPSWWSFRKPQRPLCRRPKTKRGFETL